MAKIFMCVYNIPRRNLEKNMYTWFLRDTKVDFHFASFLNFFPLNTVMLISGIVQLTYFFSNIVL